MRALTIESVGPTWTSAGLGRRAGRYPLAVERHLLSQVARLVPGVTSVTPHGRYYAVHGLVAHEAQRRNMSDAEAQELLRRVETVVAGVSLQHEDSPEHEGLNRAHGAEAVEQVINELGALDVDQASTTGPHRYAKANWGFLGPYRGSEMYLGVLSHNELRPGAAFDSTRVRESLEGLLDLAGKVRLDVPELVSASHLCICGGADAEDGLWLSDVLYPVASDEQTGSTATRRATIRMLCRALELRSVDAVTKDVTRVIAYGEASRTDDILATLPVTKGWVGTILRSESVNAWRSLWSWLVSHIDAVTPISELGSTFAGRLPRGSLGAFVAGLPSLRDSQGDLAPAERDPSLKPLQRAERDLSILMIGAMRRTDLSKGEATHEQLVGFEGKSKAEYQQELSPYWLQVQLEQWRDKPLRDFAVYLVRVLANRSQRIALRKATRSRHTGQLTVPTRVYERDGNLFKDSDEGGGPVGLRLPQMTTVLAEAGLVRKQATWQVTGRGRDVLE